MKRAILQTIFAFVVVLFFNGCASIIHGPEQTVDINSQPPGAKIILDGEDRGVTPQTFTLRRKGRAKENKNKDKKAYDLSIEMDGYYPYELKLKREMDGWFLGNILFGGIIGIIIDGSNGSMYKLNPDQIIATLGKQTSMVETETGIYLAITLEPQGDWEKIGELKKK